jgi:hypothetical protein
MFIGKVPASIIMVASHVKSTEALPAAVNADGAERDGN